MAKVTVKTDNYGGLKVDIELAIQRAVKYIQVQMEIQRNDGPIEYPNQEYNKKFSRKWFQAQTSAADADEFNAWCEECFGKHPTVPDAWCRWYRYSPQRFRFRDEVDAQWATLKAKELTQK